MDVCKRCIIKHYNDSLLHILIDMIPSQDASFQPFLEFESIQIDSKSIVNHYIILFFQTFSAFKRV